MKCQICGKFLLAIDGENVTHAHAQCWARHVMASPTLAELCDRLNAADIAIVGDDGRPGRLQDYLEMSQLPTFGPEPDDLPDGPVWSWDEDGILVATAEGFEII